MNKYRRLNLKINAMMFKVSTEVTTEAAKTKSLDASTRPLEARTVNYNNRPTYDLHKN